ncbi:T9SS type A sorting domain-containing protein [Gelatiniphilus marinus]|uniref:T9SS type A sorting domain-containing protein n=1 Tax=Gelatiniphilus marinus TaxID=1759464 RepID=A0ABW5JW02_9FLAO
MKKAILVFLLFIAAKAYSQPNVIDVPEIWEIDSWNGTNWDLLSQVTYFFNNKCFATEALGKFKDVGGSNMLENATLLTVTYNTNDLPIENLNQLWNESTSTWENHLKTEYTYSGTILTELTNYDWLNNNWEPRSRELNTYNVSNLITEKISQTWNATNTVWVNVLKTEYTYYPNEKLNVVTAYIWNSANSNWNNDLRETYTYSGNLPTALKADTWNGTIWENNRLRHYTYDSNDFLTETLKTKWNGSAFENDERVLRTNNNEGFPTEMINQAWFFGSWLNNSRDRRTYPDCNALSTNKISESELKIYPNPAKNKVTIKSKIKGLVIVVDLNGRTLKKADITDVTTTIDTSKLTNGVYILFFESENKKAIKRLVIQN